MINFFFYNSVGKIVMTGSCVESQIEVQEPLPGTFRGVGEARFTEDYWDGEGIKQRPELLITQTSPQTQANGTDICSIIGIPAGATITSNGTTITADGTDIEFVTDTPGEHKLRITLWPYQDVEVTINAI